jgi:hypothetical protein
LFFYYSVCFAALYFFINCVSIAWIVCVFLVAQEFYRAEVVVNIQRRLAAAAAGSGSNREGGAGAGLLLPTSTLNAASAPTTAPGKFTLVGGSSRNNNSSGKATATAKEAAASASTAAAAAAAAAATPAVSDFTPLNLGQIGVGKAAGAGRKKGTAAGSGTGATGTAAGGSDQASQPQPQRQKAQAQREEKLSPAEVQDRDDKKRLSCVIKIFDATLGHLRLLLQAGLECLLGLQAHQQQQGDYASAYASAYAAAAGSGGANTGAGRAPQPPPSLVLLLDLGKDPRYVSSRVGSSLLCPFHALGVYFVVEAYLFPSEQHFQQLHQALLAAAAPASVAATTSGSHGHHHHHQQQQQQQLRAGKLGKGNPSSASFSASSGSGAGAGAGAGSAGQVAVADIEDAMLRASRRRHNRFGGVLGEGGHFEHIVGAYKEHFLAVGSEMHATGAATATAMGSAKHGHGLTVMPAAIYRPTVTACALRLKLDTICALVEKFESKQKKLSAYLLNRGSMSKYAFAERFRPKLSRLLDPNGGMQAMVTVDHPYHQGSGPASACASSLLHSLLVHLRRLGLRVGDRPHQLQGATKGFQQQHFLDPALAVGLCNNLGIPFAVALRVPGDVSSFDNKRDIAVTITV